MSHIEADQGWLAHCRTTNHDLIHRVAQDGSIGCQVRTYRDSPYRDLIPGKQIAGETQKERDKEEPNTNYPVKFSRRLVRPMIKDADHMQCDRNDHQVGRPAVHITHQMAE